MSSVGENSRRKEGPDKLTGVAKYIDDYHLPNCLHGVTLRSTIARGVGLAKNNATRFVRSIPLVRRRPSPHTDAVPSPLSAPRTAGKVYSSSGVPEDTGKEALGYYRYVCLT